MPGPADLPPAGVPPEEAIAFFRSKGFQVGFAWEDVFKAEHVRAFTVAKAMSQQLLEDIRASVDDAIANGTTFADFKKDLRPKLEAQGWWGKKRMRDPATGQMPLVQLGSPRRLRTIFDTNIRTAYAAGKWERIERTKAAFPFLEYSALNDGRERPQHHAWDGTILPADDPWWDTHYPPCDWNCRCSVVQRSQRMLDRMGAEVTPEPARFPDVPWTNKRTGETGVNEAGIGKGWDYNVGKEYLRGLSPRPWPDGSAPAPAAPPAPTRTQQRLFDRFNGHFGIPPGGSAIWQDKEGHPLSIGRGWFIGANGATRVPSSGVAVDRIARAMTEADKIEWTWTPAADGRQLLVRQYRRTELGVTTIVEVGTSNWRWAIGREALKRTRAASIAELRAPLTAAEIDAIDTYTGVGYGDINSYARGASEGEDGDELDESWNVAQLDSAIDKARLVDDVVLMRVLTGSGVDWIESLDLREGSEFADAAFVSTTKKESFAAGWGSGDPRRLTLEIHAKRGTKALDITDTSSQGTGEYEVLFPRNAVLRVKGYDAEQRILRVETIADDEAAN